MKTKYIILLLVFLILGVFLRFYNIEQESMWYDEGYTLETISQGNGEMWNTIMSRDNTPPLYYFALKYWTNYFGLNVFGMRSFSAVFGILSIILIFFIGKNLFDAERGVIISAFMSTAMASIMISQEARTYSLFIFTVLLSTLFFIKAAKNSWYWILYGLSTFLMINTHFFAVFVIGIHILFYLWYAEDFEIGLLGFSEIMVFMAIVTTSSYLIYYPLLKNTMRFFTEQYPLFGINAIYIMIPLLIVSYIILFYLVDRFDLLERFLENMKWTVAVLAVFLVVYPFILSGFLAKPAFYVRYTIFLFPLIYIYFGMQTWRFKGHRWLFIIIIIVNLFVVSQIYYRYDYKEQWDEAMNFIKEDGSLMLIIDGDTRPLIEYYYKGNNEITFIRSDPNIELNTEIFNNININNYNSVYLILSHNYWDNGFWLQKFYDYTRIDYQKFVGIEVIKYGIK